MSVYNSMILLFEEANKDFLNNEKSLFETNVSERTLCGALAGYLRGHLVVTNEYRNYYVDLEYNRNHGGKIKTIVNNEYKILRICCDLIINSHGENIRRDNLIAIEMKKLYRKKDEKDSDRDRLIALTKESFDDVWSYDGKTFPEHVCRYVLGIYYEVNNKNKNVTIEYYQHGKLMNSYVLTY